ncbi:MAG: hypothetical protein ACI4PF_01980, partial [Christensenellales bacterium]
MLKKFLFYFLSIGLIIGVIICMSYVNITTISLFLKIFLSTLTVILFALSILFKWLNLKALSKSSITLFFALGISIIIYTILYKYNVLYIFSSVTTLKNYILSTEEKGVFVYILIQFLQVVFLPIPASVICIVGSLIYGPILGGIYCSIG